MSLLEQRSPVIAVLALLVIASVLMLNIYKDMGICRKMARMIESPYMGVRDSRIEERERGRRQVLLVTYGRSGSSFTSSIIQRDPQVFYFFEPLYGLSEMFIQKAKKEYGQNIRGYSWQDNKFREAYAALSGYLADCDPRNGTVLRNFQNKNSPDTADYYRCFSSLKKGFEHLSCHYQMVRACLAANVTLVKTIRFRLRWTETLLERLPGLKVLYLVRDPRAVLYSQSKTLHMFAWTAGEALQNRSEGHCSSVANDLLVFKRLSQRFPGRVKAIRYEDGAMRPLEYTRNIYQFLDLDFTRDIEDYVKSLTSSRRTDAYSVYSTDPVYTMQRWRYLAGHTAVSVVDSNCRTLYPVVGYREMHSQAELEGNTSLVMPPDPDAGIF